MGMCVRTVFLRLHARTMVAAANNRMLAALTGDRTYTPMMGCGMHAACGQAKRPLKRR